jgi:hypothetical protein
MSISDLLKEAEKVVEQHVFNHNYVMQYVSAPSAQKVAKHQLALAQAELYVLQTQERMIEYRR